MTPLQAISPGILFTLVLWGLWYLLDPPSRPEGISWTRLFLWLFTPLGIYLALATQGKPPTAAASPMGAEGVVVRLSPLQVEVFGSFWHCRCDALSELRLGDRVRVVGREGLTLVVERASY